ncbi:MAG: hypothetical protein DMF61_04300 [Blastocatellia bacterium AA13]|nr:MAG: hypothetical protein DMF61_04300 [Blastocatellia bacterium AA13]
MKNRPTIFKSLMLLFLVMSVALAPALSAQPLAKRNAAAGRIPCTATQESPQASATINLGIACDNNFAVYLGSCCSANALVGNNSCDLNECIRHGQAYTISGITGDSFLYVVAWSDSGVAQGLLASLGPGPMTAIPPSKILGGDSRWQVFSTGIAFPGSPPAGSGNTIHPTKKFQKILNQQIGFACDNNLWQTPVNGATNVSGNNVAGAGALAPPVSVVDPNARWMWFQSSKPACAGVQSPFAPGCDHGEYLIFRLPLSYVP